MARALRLIRDTGGAIVADEAGLEKTFIAGDLLQTYRERPQRALLIFRPVVSRLSGIEAQVFFSHLPIVGIPSMSGECEKGAVRGPGRGGFALGVAGS